MNNHDKIKIKAYICGYLNTFYVETTTHSLNKKKYNKYRKAALFTYFKRVYQEDSYLDNLLCDIISFTEPIIGAIYVMIKFAWYSLKTIWTKELTITGRYIVYDIGEPKLNKMLTDASLSPKEICLITPPEGLKYDRSEYDTYSIFHFLRLIEVWCSLKLSLHTIILMRKKYGVREPFFRSYSSFDYYLAFYCLERLAVYNMFIYFSTYNRWALLMSEISTNKTFIQHGIIGKFPFLNRCKDIDRAFVISNNQKMLCKKYLFSKIRECFVQKSLKINNAKLLCNGEKNILIICHSKYFEMEKKLFWLLSKKKCNLYLKPHPLESRSPYVVLTKNSNAIVLDETDFIEADIVFGYQSTLMEEYSNIGIDVHYYTDNDFEKIINNL